MISEDVLFKILVLDILKNSNEAPLKEVAWEIGVDPTYLEKIVGELGRNFLISVEENMVKWNIVDNPSNLKPWGWRLVHKTMLGSTQDFARGCGLWSIIVGEYLLYGRGRHGKKWVGNLGGLWLTFRMPTTSLTANYAPIAVPVILSNILHRNNGIDARIKWPNDIVYNDKKLAGILIEAEALRERIVLNIGIGINVNNEPPLPNTISLKKILGRLVPRNILLSLLTGWITRLEELVEKPSIIKKSYRDRLETLGKKIVAKTHDGVIEGVAVDVDEYGSLIVENGSGKKVLDPNTTLEIRYVD